MKKPVFLICFALLCSSVFAVNLIVESAEITADGTCEILLASEDAKVCLIMFLPSDPENDLAGFYLVDATEDKSLITDDNLAVYDLRSKNEVSFFILSTSVLGYTSSIAGSYRTLAESLFVALFDATFERSFELWKFVNMDTGATVYNLYFSITEGLDDLKSVLAAYYYMYLDT